MLEPMNKRLLRPAAACLVLAAASAGVAGCGSNGTSGAHNATVSARAPITKAQATAYARAVNLRARDLPDLSIISPEGEGGGPRPAARALNRCVGGVNPDRSIVRIHSAKFGWNLAGQFERLNSAVEVMPTAALTNLSNAASRSRRGLMCAKRYIPSLIAKQGTARVEYGPVTVSRLPDPLPGVAGSFGYRIAFTVTVRGAGTEEMADYMAQRVRRIRFYMDAFGFTSGPAEINMITLGSPRPVSRSVEDQLLVLLYSRTKAHRL